MTSPTSQIVNTIASGGTSTRPFLTFFTTRAPTAQDINNWQIGQRWIDTSVSPIQEYILQNLTASNGVLSANWSQLGQSSVNLNSLTGNDSVVVNPTANNINVVGTGSLTTSGAGSTLTAALTGLTNHAVLVGAGTATITKVGPGTATSTGSPLLNNGGTADPSYSTTVTFNDSTGAYNFINSTAGTNTSLAVQNLDTTNAGSKAGFVAAVGGTSSGDAFYQATSGATAWTWGTKTSNGLWILNSGNSLSGTPTLSLASTGNLVLNAISGGGVNINGAITGQQIAVQVANTINMANSHASFIAAVQGTSGGDPFTQWTVGSTISYATGIDTPTSGQPWKLTTAAASSVNPSSGTLLASMTSAGIWGLPLQPAFNASLTTQDASQTGDGTVFTLGNSAVGGHGFTKLFDQGTNFTNTASASGVFFTAPTAGIYNIGSYVVLLSLGAAHTTCVLSMVCSVAGTFTLVDCNPGAMRDAGNNLLVYGAMTVNLAASETVKITIQVAGGAKTVNIGAGSTIIYGNRVA